VTTAQAQEHNLAIWRLAKGYHQDGLCAFFDDLTLQFMFEFRDSHGKSAPYALPVSHG